MSKPTPLKSTKGTVKKQTKSKEAPTAYEKLYEKWVQSKRRKVDTNVTANEEPSDSEMEVELNYSPNQAVAIERIQFTKDENLMEMEVEAQEERSEFPTPSKEEEDKCGEEGEIIDGPSFNNNVAVAIRSQGSALGSSDAVAMNNVLETSCATERPTFLDMEPSTSTGESTSALNVGDQVLTKTLKVMQNFMMKKGSINTSMTVEELQAFLQDSPETQEELQAQPQGERKQKNKQAKGPTKSKSKPGKVAAIINSPSSTSEVTIYKRAVPQLPPEINQQLNQLIVGTRAEVNSENSWKVSSSSDELMDMSDENDLGFIVDTVAISVRIDIFSRIELIPSFVLSSDNTNYKNDIQ